MSVWIESHLEIKVDDRAAMDRHLNVAVDRMIEVALRYRTCGILVTRLGDGHFSVGLNDSVPFGYTEQFDHRNSSS